MNKLTKAQKKVVTIIGINATENCECGRADFTKESYKDSCELLAAELAREKDIPRGVSKWMNLGKKWGYWKFFKNEVKKETIEQVEKFLDNHFKTKHYNVALNDIRGFLDKLKK